MFFYYYQAQLERVVDGDTVYALVDLGFDTWKRVNIRLDGIDAFESRTRDLVEKEKGLKAKSRLTELLESTDGKFELKSKGIDKYGRCLGEIKLTKSVNNHINVNQLLVEEGLAKEYHGGKR